MQICWLFNFYIWTHIASKMRSAISDAFLWAHAKCRNAPELILRGFPHIPQVRMNTAKQRQYSIKENKNSVHVLAKEMQFNQLISRLRNDVTVANLPVVQQG